MGRTSRHRIPAHPRRSKPVAQDEPLRLVVEPVAGGAQGYTYKLFDRATGAAPDRIAPGDRGQDEQRPGLFGGPGVQRQGLRPRRRGSTAPDMVNGLNTILWLTSLPMGAARFCMRAVADCAEESVVVNRGARRDA